jgi:lipopolysaccharide transport system permease protein
MMHPLAAEGASLSKTKGADGDGRSSQRKGLIGDLSALWGARGILSTWVVREVKVRYADTRIGVGWLLLYPVAWVVLFTILFSKIFPIPTGSKPYPLFVFAGLAPWLFFSNTTSNAVSSLRNNAHLIPKVYFPREILPLGSLLVGLLDFGVHLLLLGGLMVFYGVGVGPWTLLLVPALLSIAALTLACGLLASRHALFRRDVQLFIPLALQFLIYCLPVFYPTELVPEQYRGYYLMNPLAALIDAFRRVLVYNTWPEWRSLSSAAVFSFALLILAYRDFKKAEVEFADRL